jgi:glycosyltransferase involved in cell wall biosynthesis
MSRVGVVAIGRNEGDRLRVCLESAVGEADAVVYVDSGSTDGSVELAQSLGVEVVSLDMTKPFTAARARNAGLAGLLRVADKTDYVQFVDGDCEIVGGWIGAAQRTLDEHEDVASVWGNLRERFPERSVYNRLCDMEWQWDLPWGEVETFGGIAMVRVAAFQEVHGYDEAVIAGEERDFAVRLRGRDWKIHRIDVAMALHDVAMTRFSQWWRRSVRTGFAYGRGRWAHRKSGEGTWQRETRSIWVWGVAVPLATVIVATLTGGWGLLLALIYFVQMARLGRYMRGRGFSGGDARIYGFFVVLGKFPMALGLLKFHVGRVLGRDQGLIEYK